MLQSQGIDVNGIKVVVPVLYEELSAALFFFPASYKKVCDTVADKRIMPVRIYGNTCILALTIFDYVKSPVGAYREFAISTPALIDRKFSLPLLPFVFESFFKNNGFFASLLAMNTDLGISHSEKIFGYPTFHRKISIDLDDDQTYIKGNLYEENSHIFSMQFKKPIKFKKLKDKLYNTFFLKDKNLYKVEMRVHAFMGDSFFNNGNSFVFGEHEICEKYVRKFLVSEKPIYSMYYKQANELLSAPIKI